MQISYLKAKKANICVPVMPVSYEDFISTELDVSRYNIGDMIEIRIDFIKEDIIENTKKIHKYLKEMFPGKMFVITYRTSLEGGNGHIGDENYKKAYNEEYKKLLLKLAEEVRSEFIDVELNRGAEIIDEVADICHEKGMSVIGSYHNFIKTPTLEEMIKILNTIDSTKADVIKMAVMPKDNTDVVLLMKATKLAEHMYNKPIITMSMGELGAVSRVYGFLYGSVVSFATVGTSSAPGQLTVEELHSYIQIIRNLKIALIGFMGSGKSAVSQTLSGILGIEVKDTDEEIVLNEGKSIPDIFAEKGEEYFRRVETDITEKMLKETKPLIVSCGGGVIKKEINREILKDYAVTCLLNARPETILGRVKDDTNRPLLQGKMNVEAISELMAERKEFYDMTAEVVIDVDDKSTTDISMEILRGILDYIHKYS